ncbi:hypothetical protein J945_1214 [Acinetobacter baumannii 25878_2]|nr:hypothetical protein C7R87_2718 [Acinetobacter baumannii]EXB03036.1 hypothetical protein J519_0035 [Acinetobacter baumannii 1294217]EXC86115.1 hypothetical protein J468_0051 [Acinetobacter baumannii 1043903]EXC90588.1 hypothetical protein J466_0232 [Acinetobacter baumannii 1046674]EXD19739.1 hypothetical protein J457_0775 [Acinetobacter baumannii 136706]EXG76391.1 hypothetical protein J652_1245 [Acinetobacter baumannii 1296252]EXG95980.1 hypothetical protein J650_1436 [Acinetobacter bauman
MQVGDVLRHYVVLVICYHSKTGFLTLFTKTASFCWIEVAV